MPRRVTCSASTSVRRPTPTTIAATTHSSRTSRCGRPPSRNAATLAARPAPTTRSGSSAGRRFAERSSAWRKRRHRWGTGSGTPPPSLSRRLRHRIGVLLHRYPGGRLALLLGPVLLWMLVIYLGSLGLLFITSFWRQDSVTGAIVQNWGLTNYQFLVQEDVYRTIAVRTVGIALAVTLTDIALAIPIAYYAARIATPRVRTLLLLSIVLPLWSSYLVLFS